MKSSIDLRDDKVGITAESTLGTKGIKVTFDNATIDVVLKIGITDAIELANELLEASEEKTSSDWEDEVYKLQEEINSLQETIEEYEERMDYMRRKDRYVPF